MDGHCLSPYTCKHCIVFKQFDGLNFDGLAGKHQNFPCQNFALQGMLSAAISKLAYEVCQLIFQNFKILHYQ